MLLEYVDPSLPLTIIPHWLLFLSFNYFMDTKVLLRPFFIFSLRTIIIRLKSRMICIFKLHVNSHKLSRYELISACVNTVLLIFLDFGEKFSMNSLPRSEYVRNFQWSFICALLSVEILIVLKFSISFISSYNIDDRHVSNSVKKFYLIYSLQSPILSGKSQKLPLSAKSALQRS